MIENLNKLRVAMNMPANVTELITYGWTVHGSMTKNANNFPQSSQKINELANNLRLLETTQAGCKSTPPTATTLARNTYENQVRNSMRLLSYDVQESADANPNSAGQIIESSGMSIRKTSTAVPRTNSITKGENPGDVIITSQYSGPHQWQISEDGGNSASNLTPSLISFTIVTGLTLNKTYWFRQRTMKPNSEYGAWSTWTPYTPV